MRGCRIVVDQVRCEHLVHDAEVSLHQLVGEVLGQLDVLSFLRHVLLLSRSCRKQWLLCRVELHHIRRGFGRPLLLVHGLGSNHGTWSTIIEPLAAQR